MPIIIKSKKEGFRRAGMAHSKEATTYPDDFFTEKQLDLLEAEPMLTVTRVEPEEDTGGDDKPGNPDGDEKTGDADGIKKEPVQVAFGGNDGLAEGVPIEGAPVDKQELVTWLEDENTVKDLKKICADLKIAVPAKVTKAGLIELITFNTAFLPAEIPDMEA